MADHDLFTVPKAGAEDSSESALPRDPEAASRALGEVQEMLARHNLVLALTHRQQHDRIRIEPNLVEQLVHRQALTELRNRLEHFHPADIAYILEALPLDDRMIVWDLVKAERDGEILLEVSDSVRETLIASWIGMNSLTRSSRSIPTKSPIWRRTCPMTWSRRSARD